MNGIVAGTDCNQIFSKRLVSNPSESWNILPKWNKFLTIAILFEKILCFVSINFQESVIKLVAIRKAFANCKRKYLGKILKI